MKRLAVLASALLVAALAAPALAADVELSGSMQGELVWRQKTTDDGPQGAAASTALTLNGEIAMAQRGIRVGIGLTPLAWQPGQAAPDAMVLDRFFIEASGQLWQGSPVTTARLGTLDVAYSPYVARFGQEGLSVSGIGYGPVGLSAFVGRDVADPDHTVYGAQLKAALPGAGAAVTAVNAAGLYDLELAGALMPVPGMTLSAVYARSETSDPEVQQLSRIDAQAAVRPDLTLTAGYRKVWHAFEPIYVARDSDGTPMDWVEQNRGEQGVTLGVSTLQHGVNLAAGVDVYRSWFDEGGNLLAEPQPRREASVAASTALRGVQLGASTRWDLLERRPMESTVAVAYPVSMPGLRVTPAYQATVYGTSAVKHELSAQATVDAVPQLSGLALSGRVTRDTDGRVTWGAGLGYTAPSGISISVEHDSVNGASVEAGVKAEF